VPLLIGERGAATGVRAGFGVILGLLRLVTARWIVREGTTPRPHNRWRGGGGLDRAAVGLPELWGSGRERAARRQWMPSPGGR
jgi:hypothetical protein